jgi:hypothetical protein
MRRTFLAAALLLAACTPPPAQMAAPACATPLKAALQVDLYFGRGSAGREVSDAEWASFLNEEVTPRFPDGLSVFDVSGQYRNAQGAIERERSKRLTVVVFDAPFHLGKVQAIVASYSRRHGQDSVLRVERSVCAGL